MSKLVCPCGKCMSSGGVPNELEGILFAFWDPQFLREDGREVWECRQCGRLAFSYPERHDSSVKWYKPEDGQPGDLL